MPSAQCSNAVCLGFLHPPPGTLLQPSMSPPRLHPSLQNPPWACALWLVVSQARTVSVSPLVHGARLSSLERTGQPVSPLRGSLWSCWTPWCKRRRVKFGRDRMWVWPAERDAVEGACWGGRGGEPAAGCSAGNDANAEAHGTARGPRGRPWQPQARGRRWGACWRLGCAGGGNLTLSSR